MQTVYACGGGRGGSQRDRSPMGQGADVVFTDTSFQTHDIVLPVRVRRTCTVVGPYRVRSKVRVSI